MSTIMLVDDSVTILLSISSILGKAGYAIGFIVFVFLTLLSLTMTWILKYSGEPAPAPSTQPAESLASH